MIYDIDENWNNLIADPLYRELNLQFEKPEKNDLKFFREGEDENICDYRIKNGWIALFMFNLLPKEIKKVSVPIDFYIDYCINAYDIFEAARRVGYSARILESYSGEYESYESYEINLMGRNIILADHDSDMDFSLEAEVN